MKVSIDSECLKLLKIFSISTHVLVIIGVMLNCLPLNTVNIAAYTPIAMESNVLCCLG